MLIRRLHSKIRDLVKNVYGLFKYSYLYMKERRRFGNFYFPYRPAHKGEEVYILANGPSLKEEILELMESGSDLQESLVVNFFVESDFFLKIKPKYYCLADPSFNKAALLKDRWKDVYVKLNTDVSWDMTLFVWKEAESMVRELIDNPMIKIETLSILLYSGFESKRFESYKKGFSVPSYVNVTIMALYALLNLGYSTIYLYGVDHSFLAGLGVNDNNRLCIVDKHFYGIEKYEFGPKPNGSLWTMKDFVYDKYLTFVEHEVMRGYADYLGAQIINCTKDSWIDAYVRKAQLEKQSE